MVSSLAGALRAAREQVSTVQTQVQIQAGLGIGTAGIKLATLEPGDAKSFSLERKAKQCQRCCPSAAALVPSSANRPMGYPGMR